MIRLDMRGRRGFFQYLVLQVPDILLAGLVLLLLHRWVGLSLGWAIGLFALWVLKDLVLIRWLRDIFAPPRTGPETLVGARATAQEPLAPAGYVLIRGEIWRAESLRPHETIAPGTVVIVRAARGLTLFVETHESPAAQDELQATP
jgi:membrane protein implicated in regulation of membrane protease activity